VTRAGAALLAALALLAGPAAAEKADSEQPTQIEADRMSSDETRRMTVFDGHVVLTKGTLTVRAERIVVRQDAEGYQLSVATGSPVRFRQRQDAKDGQEAGWVDGEARRIEIDDRKSTIELFEKARVSRDGDVVLGEHIFVDQRADFFSATAGKDAGSGGRVRATIQPKAPSKPPAAGQ
jgi:lipopolysaccharide export system protein LptA